MKQKTIRLSSVDEVAREMSPIKSAASTLGRKGGASKSEAKVKAARDNGKKGGRPVEIVGKIYYYDCGQCLAEFRRGGPKDWFVWSPKASQRLKTYQSRSELIEAMEFVKKSYPDEMPSLHQLDLALDGLLPG